MSACETINYIGKSVKRVDAYEKATGRAKFVEDLQLQFRGLIHVKALRSPHPHARIVRIDTTKADKLPGVVTIAKGSDPDVPFVYIPYNSTYYGSPARDEAIWAGQAVAIVAAETLEIAERAVELIDVEYEPLPYVIDQEEAFGPDATPVISPSLGVDAGFSGPQAEGPNVLQSYHLTLGDVDAAFKDAEIIVEGVFYSDKKSASPIECNSAIVEYNSDGGVTVHTNCCGAAGVVKAQLMKVFPQQLTEANTRIIQPYQGGSFGNRLFPTIEPIAVLMALRTKRTCSYTLSRREMFTSSPSNWPVHVTLKLGAKKDGTLVAEQFRLVENVGAAMRGFYDGRLSSSGLLCVYDVPNVLAKTYAVSTNTMPCGSYRGLGCPESEWAMENLMNELADKLGMSPVEIRLKNFIKRGGVNPYGEKLTSTAVAKCLQKVAEAIKLDEPSEQEPGPWRKGKGVAVGGKQNTPLGRAEADVLVHSDGSVELLISCDEQGMGAQTALAQMVATEFQIPVESVRITRADTARTPFDTFSASSRTIYTTGNAVLIACEQVIAQLKEAVGRKLGVTTRQVTIRNGKAHIVGCSTEVIDIPDLFVPFSYFTQENWGLFKGSPVRGHGVFCPAPAVPWTGPGHEDGRTPRMWNWYQFSTCAVEVAVNVETGQVKLLKVASATDTGNPINPKLIESQIDGGVMMAFGFAVMDGHVYLDGQFANGNFGDYRVPTFLESPQQENFIRIIDPDPLPDGPYGAKGMAESVMIPVGPAIAAAVKQAVGVQPRVMPMTAERILRLLKEKEASK